MPEPNPAFARVEQSLRGDFEAVPMEYRAQIEYRCKRQNPKTGDARKWVEQWISGSTPTHPFTEENLKIEPVKISWRLISNSGIDEGVIRPVIAAGGWPVVPGSSIKGLFRRVCERLYPAKVGEWCGEVPNHSNQQHGKHGVLRFHGAWPANNCWHDRLLDVVHSQQKWQIWDPDYDQHTHCWRKTIRHNANAIVSLYKPELHVAISSSDEVNFEKDWTKIREILHAALSEGIGGRTCAGYGATESSVRKTVFQCELEGQGVAAALISGRQGEFRPNMFRSAVRGMALRLFGGLCGNDIARREAGRLFGSIHREDGGMQWGLLGCYFNFSNFAIKPWGGGNRPSNVFAATGTLYWQITRTNIDPVKKQKLAKLIASLNALTYTLGGFGRSWRRPYHDVFYQDYYSGHNGQKPAIGCHWQLSDVSFLERYPEWMVHSVEDLSRLIRSACINAAEWLEYNGVHCRQEKSTWREIIHPDHMLVWARTAENHNDARAIRWFHREPDFENFGHMDPFRLKNTSIGGYLRKNKDDIRDTEVSRLWNRMLPCVCSDSMRQWRLNPESGFNDQSKTISPWPGRYLDVVTLYKDRHHMDPDSSHERDLIEQLNSSPSPFKSAQLDIADFG